jgi:DNA-binding MarR family transcriptional regulator
MKHKTAAPAIPSPGEAMRGPQGHLGYLVRQASVALRGAMDRGLAELGITTPQFSVLTMIAAYPGLSGADLARLTFLTPQTINVIVRNLERDGAIAKTAHATHGRILRLQATAQGQTLLKRCPRARGRDRGPDGAPARPRRGAHRAPLAGRAAADAGGTSAALAGAMVRSIRIGV